MNLNKIKDLIKTTIFLFSLAILQTSFFSQLPFFEYSNFFLLFIFFSVSPFCFKINQRNLDIKEILGAGVILDIFSPFFFGFYTLNFIFLSFFLRKISKVISGSNIVTLLILFILFFSFFKLITVFEKILFDNLFGKEFSFPLTFFKISLKEGVVNLLFSILIYIILQTFLKKKSYEKE